MGQTSDSSLMDVELKDVGNSPLYFGILGESRLDLSPRMQSLLARRLLALLVSRHYGLESLPEIATDGNGKPYFPNHRDIHFSLSHSRNVAVAVVAYAPIGCDVEHISDFELTPELKDLCLNAAEQSIIDRSAAPFVEFTRIWTRKESIIKRSGHIPDNPATWPSEDSDVVTLAYPSFILSIAPS